MKKQSPKPNSGQPALHKATGPRTTQGKKRSRFNALKHGLYSKFVPLEGDSIAEYRSLLNGLWDYWQPQGKQESVDVREPGRTLLAQASLLPGRKRGDLREDWLHSVRLFTETEG